jgi:hypothetical protein
MPGGARIVSALRGQQSWPRRPASATRFARHSKADTSGHKAERPNLRIVRRRCFTELKTMDEVVGALFGRPTVVSDS